MITLIRGDCLRVIRTIPDFSVRLVAMDPPYGVLENHRSWDSPLPLHRLWPELWRVLVPDGRIVIFGKQPFTSSVVMSCPEAFKYELIWEKDKGTDFGNANNKPLNAHENMLVFYRKHGVYNKQMEPGTPYTKVNRIPCDSKDVAYRSDVSGTWTNKGERTPKSVVRIARDNIHAGTSHHPTQKPVALMEWLVNSYSNPGDCVFDGTMGSGSTGIACAKTGRRFLGVELNHDFFDVAAKRISQVTNDAFLLDEDDF